jgi:agmatine/peptidylarginine deiminase
MRDKHVDTVFHFAAQSHVGTAMAHAHTERDERPSSTPYQHLTHYVVAEGSELQLTVGGLRCRTVSMYMCVTRPLIRVFV